MKTKILLVLIFSLILNANLKAQFSFTNINEVIKDGENYDELPKAKKKIISFLKKDSLNNSRELQKEIRNAKNKDEIDILLSGKSYSYESITAGILNNSKNDKSLRILFPAGINDVGSVRSIAFFEGKIDFTQFFQNNNVVYNPNLKNLSFNSEVVNDYMGPFRIGIGFQFNSTVKDNDSIATEEVKKDQLVSSLQNGGGNLFINIKYPFIAIGNKEGNFGLKSYIYHNTGVELTKINEADNDFILTNNTGIAFGAFGTGVNKKISVFFDARAGILYGNSKYNNILSVDQDYKKVLPLLNLGFGINFSDMYTVKAEFYPAGSYIKRNFPTTISFIIIPKIISKK